MGCAGVRQSLRDNRIVAGYVRVSTERQGENGLSEEEQKTRIQRAVESRFQGRPIQWFHDRKSGRNDRRPGLKMLSSMIGRGEVEIVYAISWDRLFRKVVDACRFLDLCEGRETGLCIMNAGLDTSTPLGSAMAKILVTLAELESCQISERVRAVHAMQRALGKKGPGYRPFGMVVNSEGILVPDEREQAVLIRLLSRRAQGARWKDLSRELNEQGVLSVTGRTWSPESVRSVVMGVAKRAEGRPSI